MAKICGAASNCPFSQQQTTVGCPCAELCPGYCEDITTYTTTSTTEEKSTQKG